MSLRSRLLLLVLLSSIPLFAMTLHVAGKLRASNVEDARARLATVSALAAADLRSAVESGEALLAALARIPGLKEGDAEVCRRAFQAVVGDIKRFGSFFVSDAQGRPLCHTAPLPESVSFGDRDYFRAARDTGRFATQPVMGRVTGKPLLAMAYPLRDDAGQFRGIVFASLDLEWFGQRYAVAEGGGARIFGLWAGDGTLLYRYPEPERWNGRRVQEAGITRVVLERAEPTLIAETTSVDGVQTLYSITGTEAWSGSRLAVSAGAEKAALVAEADGVFRRSALLFAMVFAASIGAALLLAEMGIRRKAVALVDAARRIAAGDLSARAPAVRGRDELGHLGESFDRMAAALERGARTLRVLTEGTQALVHARDEASLLNELCRIVVELGGYRAGWVGFARGDERKSVEPVASHGVELAALAARRLTWDDAEGGRGPVGQAIRGGRPVIVRDPAEDVGEPSSRDFAVAQGYRAYAAFPIKADGAVLGVLGIGSPDGARLDEQEVSLLAELADDLGYGIQALRNRSALDRQAAVLASLVSQRTGQLESANRFLDSLVENIPDMIFVKDAETLRFVRFNRAGEELLGYGRDDLIGRSDRDFFPPEQAEFFTARDREVLAGGRMVEIEEEPVQTRHRGIRYLHTKKLPVYDAEGRPKYLLGISEDITERKERQQEILALNAQLAQRAAQLEAVNRELESFSYSVSHDLRAPLRHVQGYVELLAASTQGALPDKAARYLRVISQAAGEMSQLIDDLLAFSRTGRIEMRRAEVDMDRLVRDCIAGLEMQVRGREVEWRVQPLPRVTGDATLLKQVWANLLGNAVKYTRGREPAVIEVGAAKPAQGPPVFHVRDNGVGFDMQHARNLFGVFQRLHRAEDFEGTGIGLATAQRIVSRHGGRIWAEAAPGQGAAFHFTIGEEAP